MARTPNELANPVLLNMQMQTCLKVQHQILFDVALVLEDVPEASGDDGHDLGQVVQARIRDESDIGALRSIVFFIKLRSNLF